MADMLTDIEQGALDRITTRIDGIRISGIKKDAAGMFVNPSVAAACLDGEMEKITQVTYRQKVTLSVLLIFKDLQGEDKRRKGINPLLLGIIQILLLQDLGLAIKPLVPLRFRDITTTNDYTEGKVRYLLQFATSYTITSQSDEEVDDLLRVGFNYYLKPGDDTADASDLLTLSE
jgi:hypothetical protein